MTEEVAVDQEMVVSQILAALKMLRSTIEACPDSLWDRTSDYSRFWVLAYHTILFAHLYLSPSEEAFEPFERKVAGHSAYGRDHLGDWSRLRPEDAFSVPDVLAYCDHVIGRVADLVAAAPFDAPSGFHWLTFTKGETHLYNLRHIQHHAGQLAHRLRQEAGIGTRWVRDGQ
ncbi:DinB family protein [Candidatus Bipolaricaulota bacterium]|nr:DinB family protein [Candidatus Bipolaricaulota bacterium]